MRGILTLVRAQGCSAWNRTRREAGDGGAFAIGAVLLLAIGIVAFPATLTFYAGVDLGERMARGDLDSALLSWNALQALFVVVFGLLGAFRYRPAFGRRDLGHLPVRQIHLTLAEIPAALIEVFPILAVAGIVCSNVGLATRLPASSPGIALLSLAGMASMIGLLLVGSAALRWVVRRRWTVPVAASLLVLLLAGGVTGNLARLVRHGGPVALGWLPGSIGYARLLGASSGLGTLAGVVLAALAAGGLLAAATWLHPRSIAVEAVARRSGRERSFRFRSPRIGVARLTVTQIVNSWSGRLGLLSPVLFAAPLAIAVWLVRRSVALDRVVPDELLTIDARLQELPIYLLFALLIVALDSNLWMNQFGLDRGGATTLLHLPISLRDVLAGKMIGLAAYFGAQLLVGFGPLWFVSRPSPGVLVAAASAGALALLTVASAGHLASARFPRAVDPDGTAAVPLHLTLLQSAILVVSHASVGAAWLASQRFDAPADAILMAAILGVGTMGYALALPWLASRVDGWRENLLTLAR